jgi:hypothetical protein
MPTFWGLRLGPILLLGLLCLGGLLFFLVGSKPAAAPLQLVTGKISYHGQPLQTGLIVFTPDTSRGASGGMAVGQIRADGTYTLQTGEAQGASPGWYRITVAAVSPTATPAYGQAFPIPYSLIPEKYRDPDLSSLASEIKPKANTNDFDLE